MKDRVTIVGGGLVGALLSVVLAKRGAQVRIFERRADMRRAEVAAGRSINLAMSDRGLRALEVAGIADDIRAIAIPMHGRVMHDLQGNQTYQPYGMKGQFINSVSRAELNKTLLTVAERHGVEIVFDARCADIDLTNASASFVLSSGETIQSEADILFGADGAFSAVRSRMQITDQFDYSQTYLEHGYKELHIPAGDAGTFQLEQHALHIWPRHSFMMIALPNLDGSFTLTLFFSHKGATSFETVRTKEEVERFFAEQFPDAVPLMPSLVEDFLSNPESSLVTVRCSPWVMNNRVALIGDAAHAIVPFYGQGMNCGFEDCRVLMECLDHTHEDWPTALQLYQRLRKPAGDAIANLALGNFIEMRDKVADPRFLWRKKIESWLHSTYPTKFIPLYTLVTFSDDVPYNEAQRIGAAQDLLMEQLMDIPSVIEDWTSDEAKGAMNDVMSALPEITIHSGFPD
ncbi:MAG: FAD-dependent monooxygenase [Candidatus Kapabacteria bacterium]|nr:FAD-dependent monooxygenase [Candidatus Kapabacteria bacterium]